MDFDRISSKDIYFTWVFFVFLFFVGFFFFVFFFKNFFINEKKYISFCLFVFLFKRYTFLFFLSFLNTLFWSPHPVIFFSLETLRLLGDRIKCFISPDSTSPLHFERWKSITNVWSVLKGKCRKNWTINVFSTRTYVWGVPHFRNILVSYLLSWVGESFH